LIVVTVPHAVGPFYVRSEGAEAGVYIRLGSTNRRAGPELLAELQRLARNTFFDEQPCSETNSDDIDVRAASELFAGVSRPLEARLVRPGRRGLPAEEPSHRSKAGAQGAVPGVLRPAARLMRPLGLIIQQSSFIIHRNLDEVLHWALSWGKDVEVLGPKKLREMAVIAVRDMLNRWENEK